MRSARRDETWLELDVRSSIVGFERNGLPRLKVGDRVHGEARFCEMAEGDSPVVDLIERAP